MEVQYVPHTHLLVCSFLSGCRSVDIQFYAEELEFVKYLKTIIGGFKFQF